jgi:hypothetical protein
VIHFIGTDDRAVACVWRYTGTDGYILEDAEEYQKAMADTTRMCTNCSKQFRLPSSWLKDDMTPPTAELLLSECESGMSESSDSDIGDAEAHTIL